MGENVFFGPDPDGLGAFEVALAQSDTPVSRETLRLLLAKRKGKRPTDVVVAVETAGKVSIFGPDQDRAPLVLSSQAAERQLQAALYESDSLAAYRRFIAISEARESSEMHGVRNKGLFASYHLRETVRERKDWANACRESEKLTGLRHLELIEALGYLVSETVSHGLLLSAGGESRALALLLEEYEGFETKSSRFQISPVDWGLAKAASQNVPWVIVLRKEQLRLYATKDGVGVGSRGQRETYFELDLAVVDDDAVGLLSLIFSAASLAEGGATGQVLAESTRFATKLGSRLRNRVYEQFVPQVATEVANQLREEGYSLNSNTLKLAYNLTLRILFRFLFQAYAENRGLLPAGRNERYDPNSLETFARQEFDTPAERFGSSNSIWLNLVQVWDAIYEGNSLWQVPAYNGGLFGSNEVRHPEGSLLKKIRIKDSVLGPALQALLIDENTEDGIRGVVDFRALSVREFGTIYEGLLESSLSLAEIDLECDQHGKWVPAKSKERAAIKAGEPYFHSSSGERKASGSYFTPSFVVDHLVTLAIDGPLDAHIEKIRTLVKEGQSSKAALDFFDFRVADLAMGSGHFLVAAVDRIEAKLLAFLTEEDVEIPGVTSELDRLLESALVALGEDSSAFAEIDSAALLRRQIAKRCIYGIDINPIAVELARLSLWIHTFVPGLPMSSLDHGLVCANSLTGIGTIDEALHALSPNRKYGQVDITYVLIYNSLTEARDLLIDAANASEANKSEMANSYALSVEAAKASGPTKNIFDTAVAARTGLVGSLSIFGQADYDKMASQEEVQELVQRTVPAHMPYLFPEVFLREQGGFDVLIGNPPWDKIQVDKHRWWALRMPGLVGMSQFDRDNALEHYRESRPDLAREFDEEVAKVTAFRKVVTAGPYDGLGKSNADLYQPFVWRNWQLLRKGGRFGIVVPRGALSGSALSSWREEVLATGGFVDVTIGTNRGKWIFDDVHQQYTVALTVVEKSPREALSFRGPLFSRAELEAAKSLVQIPVEEFKTWSSSFSFPTLVDEESAEVLRQICLSPRFDSVTDDWEYKPVQGDMNATTDKGLFSVDLSEKAGKLLVLTGSSFNLWNPNFAEPFGVADVGEMRASMLNKLRKSVANKRSAYFGMRFDEGHLPIDQVRIAYRWVTNSTNKRTCLACLLPPNSPTVNSAPVLVRRKGEARNDAFLLGVMSSMPFDWFIRRWVEMNFTFEVLNPSRVPLDKIDTPQGQRVIKISGKLAAVDERYGSWAKEVGVAVGPVEDIQREEMLIELDALIACLYQLSWHQTQHLFKTFHNTFDSTTWLSRVKPYFDKWTI